MNVVQLEKIKNLLTETIKVIDEDNEDYGLNSFSNYIKGVIHEASDFINDLNAVGNYYKRKEDDFEYTDYICVKSYKAHRFTVKLIRIYADAAVIKHNHSLAYVSINSMYEEITKEEYDKALEQAKKITNSLK